MLDRSRRGRSRRLRGHRRRRDRRDSGRQRRMSWCSTSSSRTAAASKCCGTSSVACRASTVIMLTNYATEDYRRRCLRSRGGILSRQDQRVRAAGPHSRPAETQQPERSESIMLAQSPATPELRPVAFQTCFERQPDDGQLGDPGSRVHGCRLRELCLPRAFPKAGLEEFRSLVFSPSAPEVRTGAVSAPANRSMRSIWCGPVS